MKKIILLSLLAALSCIDADEIQRIESIVNDITKLRVNYEKSQEELGLCKVTLKDEKQKSTLLLEELDNETTLPKSDKIYKEKIKNLNNQIKELKNKLETKENELNKKISTKNNKVKIKEKNTICLNNKDLPLNPFPKLKMKKEFEADTDLEYFSPSSFRVNKNATVYDAIDGENIAQWEENTSFTSNQKTQDWIKVTGHFVNKVWQKSTTEMWIKIEDAKRRDN